MADFDIKWIDRRREPKCAHNPAYPEGIDLIEPVTTIGRKACKTDLPYPAKRCGYYSVRCRTCHKSVMVTTAGRPDDPRSLTMACNETRH